MTKPAQYRMRVPKVSVFFRLRRKELERRAHTLVVQEQARWGHVPRERADWHYDMRRGRRSIYGSLLRFIDIAVEHGTPEDVLQQIPQLLTFYISDSCVERDRLRRRTRLTLTSDQ